MLGNSPGGHKSILPGPPAASPRSSAPRCSHVTRAPRSCPPCTVCPRPLPSPFRVATSTPGPGHPTRGPGGRTPRPRLGDALTCSPACTPQSREASNALPPRTKISNASRRRKTKHSKLKPAWKKAELGRECLPPRGRRSLLHPKSAPPSTRWTNGCRHTDKA